MNERRHRVEVHEEARDNGVHVVRVVRRADGLAGPWANQTAKAWKAYKAMRKVMDAAKP